MAEHSEEAARANRDESPEKDEKPQRADGERRARQAEEIGQEGHVNQVRREPIPASHHDDRGQEAVVREDKQPRDDA
jgi:hypothetical protein